MSLYRMLISLILLGVSIVMAWLLLLATDHYWGVGEFTYQWHYLSRRDLAAWVFQHLLFSALLFLFAFSLSRMAGRWVKFGRLLTPALILILVSFLLTPPMTLLITWVASYAAWALSMQKVLP